MSNPVTSVEAGTVDSQPRPLSDTDLFAALSQVKEFTPMLAEALADHIAARAQQLTSLRTAARDMAVLALQGNDYHRGDMDFRDAVDDVLAMTDPRNKSDDLEVCETCHGRRFYSRNIPGNEGVPEYDADDQPCPDCNPNGEGVAP